MNDPLGSEATDCVVIDSVDEQHIGVTKPSVEIPVYNPPTPMQKGVERRRLLDIINATCENAECLQHFDTFFEFFSQLKAWNTTNN